MAYGPRFAWATVAVTAAKVVVTATALFLTYWIIFQWGGCTLHVSFDKHYQPQRVETDPADGGGPGNRTGGNHGTGD